MRRLVLLILVAASTAALGQRIGYVDTQVLLKKHPMYVQAQAEVERLNAQWLGEVQSLFDDAEALRGQLEAERVLLTVGMAAEREKSIASTLDSAKARQLRYFAPDGQLFSKREELIAQSRRRSPPPSAKWPAARNSTSCSTKAATSPSCTPTNP